MPAPSVQLGPEFSSASLSEENYCRPQFDLNSLTRQYTPSPFHTRDSVAHSRLVRETRQVPVGFRAGIPTSTVTAVYQASGYVTSWVRHFPSKSRDPHPHTGAHRTRSLERKVAVQSVFNRSARSTDDGIIVAGTGLRYLGNTLRIASEAIYSLRALFESRTRELSA